MCHSCLVCVCARLVAQKDSIHAGYAPGINTVGSSSAIARRTADQVSGEPALQGSSSIAADGSGSGGGGGDEGGWGGGGGDGGTGTWQAIDFIRSISWPPSTVAGVEMALEQLCMRTGSGSGGGRPRFSTFPSPSFSRFRSCTSAALQLSVPRSVPRSIGATGAITPGAPAKFTRPGRLVFFAGSGGADGGADGGAEGEEEEEEEEEEGWRRAGGSDTRRVPEADASVVCRPG